MSKLANFATPTLIAVVLAIMAWRRRDEPSQDAHRVEGHRVHKERSCVEALASLVRFTAFAFASCAGLIHCVMRNAYAAHCAHGSTNFDREHLGVTEW
jgi:hypothetical protein